MISESLLTEISEIIGKENLITAQTEMAEFSADATKISLLNILPL